MTYRGTFAGLTLLAAIVGMTAAPAWAQGTPSPAPITPPGSPPGAPPGAPDAAAASGWGAGVFVFAVLGLIVILAVIAKYHDLRNRRESDALALQSWLSDALLTDQVLQGFPVTPTVHIPLSGSRAIVEVTGDVPSPETREWALRVVKRAAQSRWADNVEIHDRLVVLPPVRARAA
jgi:hypothetical protein